MNQKQKLQEIREKLHQERIEEERLEQESYDRLINGPAWKVFKILSYACAILSVLIAIDVAVPGKIDKLPFEQVRFVQGYLRVDGAWFTPKGADLQKFQEETFRQETSVVFGLTKKVIWTSELHNADRLAPREYEDRSASRRISIYSYFPLVNVAFLIPLAVVMFKRRSPMFKFMRFVCWLIIFPSTVIMLYDLLS